MLGLSRCSFFDWRLWRFFHFSFLSNNRLTYFNRCSIYSKLCKVGLITSTFHCSLKDSSLFQIVLSSRITPVLISLLKLLHLFVIEEFSYLLRQIWGLHMFTKVDVIELVIKTGLQEFQINKDFLMVAIFNTMSNRFFVMFVHDFSYIINIMVG